MTFTKENFKFSEAANAFQTDTPSKTIRYAPQPNVSNYFHGIWNLKKKNCTRLAGEKASSPQYIFYCVYNDKKQIFIGWYH